MGFHWWLAQGFAVLGLIFVVIAFQQKETKKLLWLRIAASISVFTGMAVLGNTPAMLMCGAGLIRNLISLYYAYKPNSKKVYKIVSGALIVALLIALNIIFWSNYMNILSMAIGTINVFAFMQEKTSRIRLFSMFGETIAVVYYSILFAPINIAIEVFGLVSAIIGMIRLDRKKISELQDNQNHDEISIPKSDEKV